MKLGSENVALANMFNIKEDRQLEKTLATIKLEEDYAMKLLQLSNRQAYIHSRRLKARVGRIQSHLSIDDIQQLRTLEMEGKLKPLYSSVEADGTKRIAIAARRLGIKTAVIQKKEPPSPHAKRKELLALAQQEFRRKQLEQMTPDETDDAKETSQRDDSMERVTMKTPNPCSSSVKKKVRSHSSVVRPSASQIESARVRPASTTGFGPNDRALSPSPRATTSLGYSSHDLLRSRDNTSSASSTAGQSCTPGRRLSTVSTSSVALADAIMKNVLAERRQELLDHEYMNGQDLVEKQRNFLNKVDGWVRDNPSQGEDDPSSTTRAPRPRARSRQRRQLRFSQRDNNNEVNRVATEADWKELHKCRYLRVAEELIDLSGVVTLAREQMKIFNSLRVANDDDDFGAEAE